jgi:c-di-GMP-binding flagellar brake protein YcgR
MMKEFISRIFNKRKNRRCNVEGHELVIFGAKTPFDKKIVDLSLGGISFVYEDTGTPLNPVFDMDIKVDDGFHLGKVRAKTISDDLISEVTREVKMLRRRTARFINISPVQEYELKKFLKDFGKKFSF